MKTAIVLFAFVTMSIANAAKVGDSSSYNVVVSSDGATQTFVQVETAKAINAEAGTMVVVNEVYQDGTLIRSEDVNHSLAGITGQEQIVNNCPSALVEIKVAAGTFKTCHVTQGGADFYFGPVFTGLVKGSSSDGGISVSFELIKYVRN